MSEKEKLNIFDVLNKFNKHDDEFFRTLDPEDAKQIHPFVMQRWLSGTDNPMQVIMLNEVANRKVFSLSHNHKLLTWYLLIAATCNSSGRYTWSKLPTSKTSSTPLSIDVICRYYGYSKKKAFDAIKLLSPNDVIELAVDLGTQDTDIRKIEKELGVASSKKPRSNKT